MLKGQIGKLRKRKRVVEVTPAYYRDVRLRRIDGRIATMMVAPFDGQSFLPHIWKLQDELLWLGRSGSILTAAAIDYDAEQRLKEGEKRKERAWICDIMVEEDARELLVEYKVAVEGKWIAASNISICESVITALTTIKAHISLRKEKHKVILPPGTVAVISPVMLSNSIVSSILLDPAEEEGTTRSYIQQMLDTSRTQKELAQRLMLSPAKIKSKLKRGESEE